MKNATLRQTCDSEFDPRDHGDVSLWYCPSDLNTLTIRDSGDGLFVSEMRNKAGDLGTLTQAVAVRQPRLVADEGGMQPFLRTSNTAPNWLTNAAFPNSLFGTTNCTIFVAAKPRLGNQQVRFLYDATSGSERVLIFWPFNQSQSTFYHRSAFVNSSTVYWDVTGTKEVLAYHRRGARIATFRNAGLIYSADTAEGSLAAVNRNQNLLNSTALMSTQYRGDFYEMVVYTSPLPDEAIDVISQRMLNRWGA